MVRTFNGKTPKIAPTAFVSEAAYVIGDVEMGENSSVWPGAVVRGDVAPIKIGDNSQIEDNCVVHTGSPLVIGDSVHVGHNVVIHCSKIGNNVLVGNNATLLDDAEIGDYCLIAAGSLVGEGVKIPSGSFVVGMPAKVKGTIKPEQLARIEYGVKYYVKLTEEYKKQGLE
ncbi:gamma carbonic anhydrase family protein [Chloroflexota bacterium]